MMCQAFIRDTYKTNGCRNNIYIYKFVVNMMFQGFQRFVGIPVLDYMIYNNVIFTIKYITIVIFTHFKACNIVDSTSMHMFILFRHHFIVLCASLMNSPKGGNVNQGQPGKTFFPDFICQHIPPSDIKNIQEIP